MPLDFTLRSEPLLARRALDRAAELRDDEKALQEGWPSALIMRVDRGGCFRTDVADDGRRRVLLEPAFDLYEQPPRQAVFLGRDHDGRHVWALGVDLIHPGADVVDLRAGAALLAVEDAAMAAEAVALLNWHREIVRERDPRHQPRRALAGWAGEDPFHGGLEFPRTDAATICLVHDSQRKVLLGRNPSWPQCRFSLLAGFVEPGESLENCVAREVYEEVGVTVQRIRYLGSQPWPFPRSLMVGFHALADPDAPLVLEESEIAEARWFDVTEVAAALRGDPEVDLIVPPSVSIARLMIESWVEAVGEPEPEAVQTGGCART